MHATNSGPPYCPWKQRTAEDITSSGALRWIDLVMPEHLVVQIGQSTSNGRSPSQTKPTLFSRARPGDLYKEEGKAAMGVPGLG